MGTIRFGAFFPWFYWNFIFFVFLWFLSKGIEYFWWIYVNIPNGLIALPVKLHSIAKTWIWFVQCSLERENFLYPWCNNFITSYLCEFIFHFFFSFHWDWLHLSGQIGVLINGLLFLSYMTAWRRCKCSRSHWADSTSLVCCAGCNPGCRAITPRGCSG